MWWLQRILISTALLALGTQVFANECLSQMSNGARPVGQVKLCHSTFTGLKNQYSCQDYQEGTTVFRVLYKGGLEPKAIIKHRAGQTEKLVWSTSFGDQSMRCPLTAPSSVPKHAKHRGLGICMDERNNDIPCSVYEHKTARESSTWRYLVFYQADGVSNQVAHRMAIGNNEDAMVAELAYQLGLSLLETSCCSDQAAAYLEHAHRLFPRARAYKLGYLQALEQMAANEE